VLSSSRIGVGSSRFFQLALQFPVNRLKALKAESCVVKAHSPFCSSSNPLA
jgi:hypothetical protein